METKNKIWQLIINEIRMISPAIYGTLNPPADQVQIDILETKLNIQLPNDFKRYLQTFNGQNEQGRDLPLIGNNRFLSVNEIMQDTEQQLFLFADEEPLQYIQENKIKPVLWDNLWIPFATFESSTRLILDMNAGKNGENGQILLHYPGVDMESDEIVIAPSFDSFSQKLFHRLTNGEYKIDNGTINFNDKWII